LSYRRWEVVEQRTEVIVVGAGPTGLLLAGDLAQGGAAVTVLERWTSDTGPPSTLVLRTRTLEILDIRGVGDDLLSIGKPVGKMRPNRGSHVELRRSHPRYPDLVSVPRQAAVRVLEDRARALGAHVVRRAAVSGLRQDAAGVDIDGPTRTTRARFVVGADGAQSVTRRALESSFVGEERWLAHRLCHGRRAPRYRFGSVFLAGDAAHFHLRAGGRNVDTGLDDAANLGWKMAAVLRGWAPEALLDTYAGERSSVECAMIGIYALLARRVMPAVLRRVPSLLHQGALDVTGIGAAGTWPSSAHPSIGQHAADVLLPDGRRLHESLRAGRPVLVTSGSAPRGWADHVDVVAPGTRSPAAVLVRPDARIAWATDPYDAAAAPPLRAALLGRSHPHRCPLDAGSRGPADDVASAAESESYA
jgi:hypothetical protein